jgi:DNA-binding response OmpR family regulator
VIDRRSLLVVDDEPAICKACQRLFTSCGFRVESCTSATEGLRRATESEYAVILLDVRFPEMDGIAFLRSLREHRPDVPVLIMTGFPSLDDAASAIRLGVSDYVTKPFSPEEIVAAVQRVLVHSPDASARELSTSPAGLEAPDPRRGGILFLDESWAQRQADGTVQVGAVLPRSQVEAAVAVRLPRIGERVLQGLPLAALRLRDDSLVTVPSPVSGSVLSVNGEVARTPGILATHPCSQGWLAGIYPTAFDDDAQRCRRRRLILANADEASAERQARQLAELGCEVDTARDWKQLAAVVKRSNHDALLLDAGSFGPHGPELVGWINVAAPAVNLVVIASATCPWEAAYREEKILYYAVDPFEDGEIVEILEALSGSRAAVRPLRPAPRSAGQPMSCLSVVVRDRTRVCCFAEPGLLRGETGLGRHLVRELRERLVPVWITVGEADLTPKRLAEAAAGCDFLFVLRAEDTGRIPGSLNVSTGTGAAVGTDPDTDRVTVLSLQPDASGGLDAVDDRIVATLAGHIVREMVSRDVLR